MYKLSVFKILIMNHRMQKKESRLHSFALQFAFGGLAAFVSKTVASPIEVQYALIEKGHLVSSYQGISDCFKRLYAEGGLLTFFKGNGTNALRFLLTQALNFSFRDLFRNLLDSKKTGPVRQSSFLVNLIAGGTAGASTQLIVYPLDFARTRLANQVKMHQANQFNGLTDCIKKTFKTDGVEGLYRGFTVSCLCMVIYRGLYFGIYDSLRPYMPHKYDENMLATFSLGYVATITSGAFSYPLDTVRRRMMMTSGQQVKFASTIDCMRKIYSQGGWKAFFRGGAANIVGGVTGAAVFSVYDRMKIYYQQKYYGL